MMRYSQGGGFLMPNDNGEWVKHSDADEDIKRLLKNCDRYIEIGAELNATITAQSKLIDDISKPIKLLKEVFGQFSKGEIDGDEYIEFIKDPIVDIYNITDLLKRHSQIGEAE